ncbi:MAG TPA: DUF3386 family protein [Candidatus Tectomicrobia bacterium]|nr:DUF3386 family protein [Candidatus Tectomicrobia bacterium]
MLMARATTQSIDLEARRLLQEAQGTFQKWPETFRGFTATLRCTRGPSCARGVLRVAPGGGVGVDIADRALRRTVEAWLRATSDARTPRFFKDGDGRFPISFEQTGDAPAGQRVVRVEGGVTGWRRYWIDERARIRRHEWLTPERRGVQTFDGYVRTSPGRALPTRGDRVEWDVVAEALVESVIVEEVHCRVEHVWLPRAVRLTSRRRDAEDVTHVELEQHALV